MKSEFVSLTIVFGQRCIDELDADNGQQLQVQIAYSQA